MRHLEQKLRNKLDNVDTLLVDLCEGLEAREQELGQCSWVDDPTWMMYQKLYDMASRKQRIIEHDMKMLKMALL